MASARILQLSASAKRAILVEMLTLDPLIALIPFESAKIPPPTPISPLASSSSDSLESFVIAFAKIFIASAKAIKAIPVFTNGALLRPVTELDMDLKLVVSILNMIAIAPNDFAKSGTFILDNLLSAKDKIPIAAAIETNEVILMLDVKALRDSLRVSKISGTFSAASPRPKKPRRPPPPSPFTASFFLTNCEINSYIFPITPRNFIPVAAPIPFISPEKISPIETLSLIHPNTVLTPAQIFSNAFDIASPAFVKIFPNPPILSVAPLSRLEIPVTLLDNVLERLLVSNPSLIFVRKSPTAAPASKNKSTRLPTPFDPSNWPIGFNRAVTIFLPMSKTENIPLKVECILSLLEFAKSSNL